MRKYVQTIWMRILSCILCTIFSIGLVISVLGFFFFAELDGVEHLDELVKEEIAETYALYAIDEIEKDSAKELEEYFSKKGIACSVQYVFNTEEVKAENQEKGEVLFSTGTLDEKNSYLIEMVPGTASRYDVDSLFSVLTGYMQYDSINSILEFPIEAILFDGVTGVFYFRTEVGLFEIPTVTVWQDGAYLDYNLIDAEGEKCYYNGYYKTKLDTSQYATWNQVEINGYVLGFMEMPEEFDVTQMQNLENHIWQDGIIFVPDITETGIPIRDNMHAYDGDYVWCEYGDYMDKYQIRMNWEYGKLSENSLFLDWQELYEGICWLERHLVPSIVLHLLCLIASGVLFFYAAIGEKERLGFLHKIPVGIYSGIVCAVEIVLCYFVFGFLVEYLMYRNLGNVENTLMLAALICCSMVYLGFVYLQNIVARIKTKTFLRNSEFYYGYRILNWTWRKLTAPVKTCMEMVRNHIPLVVRALLILGVLSFAEFLVIIICWWDMDAYMLFFIPAKIVEILIVILVAVQMQKLQEGSKRIASGDLSEPIDTSKMFWEFKRHGENINKVSDGIALAVEDRMKSERFKTELITNVSHDIKTPLTSIINYVDLIKKEEITDETLKEYIDVLDRQSARLKKLIEDLMEASKASTGNLAVNLEDCDVEVLLTQLIGEFEEKLSANQLEVVVQKPEHPVIVSADGRHMWRVFDNLLNNACKYSLSGTRVYISLTEVEHTVTIVFKNISKAALNIESDELMERFVRGDSSRNTEGSGLGLSIAQSLTELMSGTMKLEIDGDLFKVTLTFQSGSIVK